MKKVIIDLLTVVFLGIIIFLRVFEKDSGIIGILTYVSILIALYDLYVKIEKKFGEYGERFLEVRGSFILLAILGTVMFTVILAGVVILSSKIIDLFSIVALLISLPSELYCFLIGKFIKRTNRRN